MIGRPRPGPPPGGAGQQSSPQADVVRDREFGHDGVSGLMGAGRALRARDVSRPTPADRVEAEQVVAQLLARVEGRRGLA